ncbi:eukaryotic translation initiation factor 4 gamma 1-like [Schistocerca piceifrons]|uniref:eukaryotic translation initiation factor 4 gamma 1-like n=1 Tax=Schistocerca piceifrons TaxID=274613 RepID=UPI001F5F0CF1|nr:eukaryotic translation initiation factor 4 gamma 1-like [Schistocerca piceifrons]
MLHESTKKINYSPRTVQPSVPQQTPPYAAAQLSKITATTQLPTVDPLLTALANSPSSANPREPTPVAALPGLIADSTEISPRAAKPESTEEKSSSSEVVATVVLASTNNVAPMVIQEITPESRIDLPTISEEDQGISSLPQAEEAFPASPQEDILASRIVPEPKDEASSAPRVSFAAVAEPSEQLTDKDSSPTQGEVPPARRRIQRYKKAAVHSEDFLWYHHKERRIVS